MQGLGLLFGVGEQIKMVCRPIEDGLRGAYSPVEHAFKALNCTAQKR